MALPPIGPMATSFSQKEEETADPKRSVVLDYINYRSINCKTEEEWLAASTLFSIVRDDIQQIIESLQKTDIKESGRTFLRFLDGFYSYKFERNPDQINEFFSTLPASDLLKKIKALFALNDPELFATPYSQLKPDCLPQNSSEEKQTSRDSLYKFAWTTSWFFTFLSHYAKDTTEFSNNPTILQKAKAGEELFSSALITKILSMPTYMKHTVGPSVIKHLKRASNRPQDQLFIDTYLGITNNVLRKDYLTRIEESSPTSSRDLILRMYYERTVELYYWAIQKTVEFQEDFFCLQGLYSYLINEDTHDLQNMCNSPRFPILFKKKLIEAGKRPLAPSTPNEIKQFFTISNSKLRFFNRMNNLMRICVGSDLKRLKPWLAHLAYQKKPRSTPHVHPINQLSYVEVTSEPESPKRATPKTLTSIEHLKVMRMCFSRQDDSVQNAARFFDLLGQQILILPACADNREALFSWTMRSVKYSSLFIEQLLPQTTEDPKVKISHDLVTRLNHCKSHGELSSEYRQMIADLNGGEVGVRFLPQFNAESEESNQLEKLLQLAWSFRQNPNISPQRLLQSTINFLEDVFDVGLELSTEWKSDSHDLATFWLEVRKTSRTVTSEQKSHPPHPLQAHLHHLAEKLPGLQDDLLNISDNLIEQLLNLAMPDPAFADQLLSETGMLTQYAIEELLMLYADMQGKQRDFTDHNLIPIFKELKIGLTPEEKEYVNKAAAMRQFLRYPARFFKEKKQSTDVRALLGAISLSQKYVTDAGSGHKDFKTKLPKADQESWNQIRTLASTERTLFFSICEKILTSIERVLLN